MDRNYLGWSAGLLVLTAIILSFVGGVKLSKKYDVPVQTVSIPTSLPKLEQVK
jgi:hypothetical protein